MDEKMGFKRRFPQSIQSVHLLFILKGDIFMGKQSRTAIFAAIVAFSFILSTGILFAETKATEKNEVALVNGTPIPTAELDRAVALAVQRSQRSGQSLDRRPNSQTERGYTGSAYRR